mgnify:CR=1 FL=1|jgi:hypothetical protein|nr:MAG TPA: hypothetical protein [Caudoviricetes sp.]
MTDFINQTRVNHHGFTYTVTSYNPLTKRYTVHFPHSNVTKEVTRQSISGNIVSEKALIQKATKSMNQRTSTLYYAMLQRLNKNPAYKNVRLDPRWNTLEGFRETIHQVEGYEFWKEYSGFSLDKDQKGMNTYGPDSCVFIPLTQNSSQPRKKTQHKSYKVGTKLNIQGQVAVVVGKLPARTIIRFEETGELREVWTHNISINGLSKSTKGG